MHYGKKIHSSRRLAEERSTWGDRQEIDRLENVGQGGASRGEVQKKKKLKDLTVITHLSRQAANRADDRRRKEVTGRHSVTSDTESWCYRASHG